MFVITRYVLSELIKAFVPALIVMTMVMIFSEVVKELQEQGFGAAQIIMVLPYVMPYALKLGMHGAILFAVCNVYGRMAASNELVALKSVGVSALSVMWPGFLLAFVLSFIGAWLDDVNETWAHNGIQLVQLEQSDKVAYGLLRTHRSFTRNNFTIAVKKVDGHKLILPSLTIKPSDSEDVITISAREGELRLDHQKNELVIALRSGRIAVENKVEMTFTDTIEQSLPLTVTEGQRVTWKRILQQRVLVENLTKLWLKYTASLAASGKELPKEVSLLKKRLQKEDKQLEFLEARLQQKWSNSFCCLAFVMIGIPVSIQARTADYFTSFFICFLPIVIGYQPMQHFVISLAKSGRASPYLIWFGNVILVAIGSYLLRRVLRH